MTVEKRKGISSLLTVNGVTRSTTEWAKITGVDVNTISRRIREGWPEDKIFDSMAKTSRYSFNEHYFDVIDNEHKAYWIGFIWCDGYLAIRNRNDRNSTSYEFKLSLQKSDDTHLKKLNEDLNSNYKINYYTCNGFRGEGMLTEARLLITNQYFGKILAHNYGLIPNRSDCSKLLSNIPSDLMRHFIRGVIDADGSFSHYIVEESSEYGTYIVHKCAVDIGGQPELLKQIEQYLIKNNVVNNFNRKIYKRHQEDERDGVYRSLKFCGRNQATALLHYIYDNATVYLDRKYEKFLNIVNELEGNNELQTILK